MSDHRSRLARLEACTPRTDVAQAQRDAALTANLGDFLEDMLDAAGRPRADLSPSDRRATEEVLTMLELGEERARQVGESADDGPRSR